MENFFKLLFVINCLSFFFAANAATEKPHYKSWSEISFIDPDDGYFDMSDFIINAHGFIPIPTIVTEPAVGGFGGGIFPVFIEPKPPIERDGKLYPQRPDVTFVGGMYTLNNTWAVAAGRVGTFEKYGLKYKAVAAYADANIDFYTPPESPVPDQKIEFNMRGVPIYLYLTKELPDPRFSLGLDYAFANIDVKPEFENPNIPDSWEQDFQQNISMIGAVFEFDNRDNTFTPNHGFKINMNARFGVPALGSDAEYQRLEEAMYYYFQFADDWTTGIRLDFQQIFDEPPFYLKPYVDMRGVPAARYQGNYTGLIDVEERYDFGASKRWSLVAFGGVGTAVDTPDQFKDAKLVYGYGAGFRYLLVKKLGIRVGIDVANGRDGPAWYIVFGNGWVHQ